MTTRVYHLDKTAHHLLASGEVSDHTVAKRADSADIVVSLLIHALCSVAHCYHLIGATVKSYDRRFVHHNLVIADDNGVGSAKVHCYFLYEREKSHCSDEILCITYEVERHYLVLSNHALIAVS